MILERVAKAQSLPISVEYLKGKGHSIGGLVYSNPRVWNDALKVVGKLIGMHSKLFVRKFYATHTLLNILR